MTNDELKQNLVDKFTLWTTQVKRLIRAQAWIVTRALDTKKINGNSTADLIAIIDGEVAAHEAAPNPHQDTLAIMGGMTRGNFDALAANYFPKDGLPITQVPLLAITIVGTTLTVPATTMIYQGRKITIPRTDIALDATAKVYLKIQVTGTAPNRVATPVVTTSVSEDIANMIVGTITFNGVVYTPSIAKIVRIGFATLSPTPRGLGIPTSTGTQAQPGSTPSTWYS